jgi:hypothetical protein
MMILSKKKLFSAKFILIFLSIILILTLVNYDNVVSRHIKSNLIYFMPVSNTDNHYLQQPSLHIKSFNEIADFFATTTTKSPINSFFQKQIDTLRALHKFLHSSEKKYFSQNKEDGVLVQLAALINRTENGVFVEIGAENGQECNTRYLREKHGWHGLYLDNKNRNENINLHKETVTHQNVLDLLEKYKVNETNLDLLSEDTDFADYWILEKILVKYKPKIIVHEINEQPPNICVTVLKPLSFTEWSWGSEYHGASLCAFQCLAQRFDYTIVYCETAGVNCFWLRNDLLFELFEIRAGVGRKALSVDFLWRKPSFTYRTTENDWHHVKC